MTTNSKYLPPATKLGQGYIFTGVCHSVNRGGVLSQHALQVVSQHALQQVSGGGSAPGGFLLGGCGLLLWLSVVVFCYALLVWCLLIEGGLLTWSSGGEEGHNRRPPHQKVTNAWWRHPPLPTAIAAGGTHPTGMHYCSFRVVFTPYERTLTQLSEGKL